MDGNALQLTLREMRGHLTDVRVLGIMTVVGLVLGLAGPFGSFAALDLLPRLVYWVATVFLTYCFGFGSSLFADRLWGVGRPFWLRLLIMSLPAGLGATLIVTLLNFIAFGGDQFEWIAVLVLLGQCFAVAIGVEAVVLLAERRDTEAQNSPSAPPAILERVPPQQRGALVALIVEDHYVDIVTERGKTLVLMRLADAIREAGSIPGLQIHRSHWVARAAVVRAHRRDGKVILELSNGMHLPVSRGYLPAVREADLL
ncbi:MAG: LytTR family DNA-binding domain-containing protein [Devosia sp.]